MGSRSVPLRAFALACSVDDARVAETIGFDRVLAVKDAHLLLTRGPPPSPRCRITARDSARSRDPSRPCMRSSLTTGKNRNPDPLDTRAIGSAHRRVPGVRSGTGCPCWPMRTKRSALIDQISESAVIHVRRVAVSAVLPGHLILGAIDINRADSVEGDAVQAAIGQRG